MTDGAAPETELSVRIKREARALGFDRVGITRPDRMKEAGARLHEFLALGHHGTMAWMEARADERADPAVLWPAARSAVVVGLNYGPAEDPLRLLNEKERGIISAYAQGADYHDVLKKRLKRLARWVHRTTEAEVKVFVDTAPVMEKPLAEAAGIGWQGKHTNLVAREFGSWLFLGVMLTEAELAVDAPEADRCGSCRRCLDICPTDAFPAPYRLDARRCISYLTIEHKGHIDAALRPGIGNRIYGCDDCLAVCPWNKFAVKAREAAFHPRPELTAPLLSDLAALDDTGFRQMFAGSPIKRVGRDRFIRNVMIAIGNSADPDLAPGAEARLTDVSPLVRAMAVWALGRLMPQAALNRLAETHLPAEADADVRAEWHAALNATCGAGGGHPQT